MKKELIIQRRKKREILGWLELELCMGSAQASQKGGRKLK
jgi:hypothetical protein